MSLSDQWGPTSVQVTVLQARGLRIKGKNGTNDAYAVMHLGKEKYQTSVAEKSVAPVWKEEASFDMPQQGNTERGTLHVHVLHRALVGPDKLLGQAVINLLQLREDKNRDKTQWFKLLDKSGKLDKDRGEVLVDIQFIRNNMTASMFDISAAGKPRSRLGKFKVKVKGKKKEDDLSETSSNVVPAPSQVMTGSEDEEDSGGEGAAKERGQKKKSKVKSLFSHKTNLQKSLSQSMSVLPGKNSSLSGSMSSGLNVEASEGKKKFKFLGHKRTASSDKKEQKLAAEQSNLCINGSHIYCDEPAPRTSRTSSNFSLASSGVGSMEDVPDSSPPSLGSRRSVRHSFPWTEEEETVEENTQQVDDEVLRRQELEKLAEEERRMEEEERNMAKMKIEEEERRQREEEERRMEEEKRRIEQERLQREEVEKRAAEMMRAEEERKRREEEERIEEERRIEAEERRRRELEERERVRREEERIRLENEQKRQEEEKRRQAEEEQELRLEAERKALERRREEEREELRKQRLVEEERKRQEQERREEELRVEIEREEARRRAEEEEERKRLEEEERIRLEREKERLREEEEEKRLHQEEKKRLEEEERLRLEREKERLREEEEEKRLQEEEKKRLEEEERIRLEREKERLREEEEQKRLQEEERKRLEEEERIRLEREKERLREEEEKLQKEERKRLEEEERIRLEREKERLREEEEQKKLQEEERKRLEEEERIKLEKEKERLREEEEEKRLQEEKKRQQELKQEQKRIRLEEEKMRLEKVKAQEEKERKEKEEEQRVKEEERRKREEENEREEKRRREEEEERATEKEAQRKYAPNMTSTNPFDESDDENVPESAGGVISARQRCKLPVERNTSASDVSISREKRQAPKPPRMNSSGIQQAALHEAQVNQQIKDKEIKTASVLPQRSVQKIHVASSSSQIKPQQPEPSPHTDRSSGRRPAPQIPCLTEMENPLPNDPCLTSKQTPAVSNSNPFEDDEDIDELADTTAPVSVIQPPLVQGSVEKDTVSSAKTKSSKTAHAPPPPAITTNTPDSPNEVIICDMFGKKDSAPVQQISPKEPQAVKEENARPIPSRRLQPVRPLNPQDQKHSSSVEDRGDKKFIAEINSGENENIKGSSPYALLTQEELISLVIKQENQLLEKSKKISELEQYIDNLLVRVMEEAPNVLMSIASLK